MKGITIEQIEHKLTEYKDQPRKLKHWQVKKAAWDRLHPKKKEDEPIKEKIKSVEVSN